MAQRRSMIWELLRISLTASSDSRSTWYSSLGKCVFSCRLATDTVQRTVKSPKAVLTASWVPNLWPERHLRCLAKIGGVFTLAFLERQNCFSRLISVCNLQLVQKVLFAPRISAIQRFFFLRKEDNVLSCQHNLEECLYTNSLFKSLQR